MVTLNDAKQHVAVVGESPDLEPLSQSQAVPVAKKRRGPVDQDRYGRGVRAARCWSSWRKARSMPVIWSSPVAVRATRSFPCAA